MFVVDTDANVSYLIWCTCAVKKGYKTTEELGRKLLRKVIFWIPDCLDYIFKPAMIAAFKIQLLIPGVFQIRSLFNFHLQ